MKAILSLIFLFVNFTLLPDLVALKNNDYSTIDNIDPESWKKAKIDITAKGTGNTTGNIANLTVQNNSDIPYLLDWEAFFIPTLGKYQSYLVPEGVKQEIPPKSTVIVPVTGFCTDPRVPPVGADDDFPPFEKWIQPIPDLPIDWIPQSDNGWKYNPVLKSKITIPGTDILLTHTINQVTNPVEFASLIDNVYKRIIVSKDSLRKNDLIHTPYSSNPKKEDTILIQQTVWIFSYSVLGGSYEKEDFEKKIYTQFEEKTSMPVEKIPVDKKSQLDLDISSLWDAFQLTGVEAKIISPKSEVPNFVPEDNPVLIDQKYCECDTIAFDAKIVVKGVSEDILQFTNQFVNIAGTRRSEQKTILSSTKPVATGDTIYIDVKNLKQTCKICETNRMKCTVSAVAPPFISYGELLNMNSNFVNNSININPLEKQRFVVTSGNNPIGVKIEINYQCQSPKCTSVDCKEEFLIKIPRNNAACDCPVQKLEFKVQHENNPAQSLVFEKGSEKTFSTKVNKRDKVKITLDKDQLKPACDGCEKKCAPFDLKYKIFGQGFLTLPVEDKAKSVEYKAKEIKILDNKSVKTDNSPVEVVFETNHECKASGCRTKICTNRYKIKFERN